LPACRQRQYSPARIPCDAVHCSHERTRECGCLLARSIGVLHSHTAGATTLLAQNSVPPRERSQDAPSASTMRSIATRASPRTSSRRSIISKLGCALRPGGASCWPTCARRPAPYRRPASIWRACERARPRRRCHPGHAGLNCGGAGWAVYGKSRRSRRALQRHRG